MTRVTLWVDAISPNPGGIGRYTSHLAQGLAQRGDLQVRFFGRNRIIEDPSILLRDAPLPRRPGRLRRWLDRRALKASLVHGPNYFLPSFAETGIITIHDLSVFRHPETHPVDRVLAFEREFERSLARAAHVITDTETVRAELMESFSVAPDRVTAVPLGVDPAFRPQAAPSIELALRKWDLEPGKYGLCVSTLEPRKKISELLAAWRRLPRPTRAAFPLVLCGGAGWRNEALRRQVEVGAAEGWLRHLGFVPEAMLPTLYAGAAMFIYPSIYEGFGLPPLEALASGVPVMVSRHSCLPEVCGDAARYFDPDDAPGFTAAIEHNLADERWRAESLNRGIDRARQFSWDRCIDGTVAIYRKVAAGL
jgi:alpha-1,3-rhamnosyl/mannosyltransferase